MTTDIVARPRDSVHIAPLDGVRAVAVLIVLAYHAHLPLFVGGYVGVDIFFVLSGYLITANLLRELSRTGGINLRAFYLKRVLRLLPALTAVCIVVAVVWWFTPWAPVRSETLWGIPAGFTYLSSWVRAFDINSLGYMGHVWSLSVEEHFYLVWPLVLVALFRFTRKPRLSIMVVAALAVIYRLSSPFWADLERIYNGSDTQAAQLLIGCAVAAALRGSSQRIGMLPAVLSIIALLAIVAFMPLDSPAYLYGGSLATGLAAATLIAYFVTDGNGVFGKLLALKPFKWVGDRSYGIYLWHYPIFGLVSASAIPGLEAIALSVVLSFVIPDLSFRYIEEPFRRIKQLHFADR